MVSNSALRAEWPSWAKIGAKVVLIDGKGGLSTDKEHLEGQVFVIIERSDEFGVPAVRVRNMKSGDANPPWEFGKLSRYRPLVTKTQDDDVGMFKELTSDIPPSARLEETLAYRLDLLEIAWNASN